MQHYHERPGRYVFIGNNIAYIIDQKLRIMNPDGETVWRTELPAGRITALVASSESNKIAVGYKGKIYTFEGHEGKHVNTMSFDEKSHISSMEFSPNGKYIACAPTTILNDWKTSKIVVFNVDSNEIKYEKQMSAVVDSISFNLNGSHIAFRTVFKFVIVNLNDPNDIKTSKLKATHGMSRWSPMDAYMQFILAPSGAHVAGITRQGILNVSDFSGANIYMYDYKRRESNQYRYNETIKLLPDGKRIAIISGNRLTMFDAIGWIPQFTMNVRNMMNPTITFSPDSKRMIISSTVDGASFLRIPKNHFSLLDSELGNGIHLFPGYVNRLRENKTVNDRLLERVPLPGITNTIMSYLDEDIKRGGIIERPVIVRDLRRRGRPQGSEHAPNRPQEPERAPNRRRRGRPPGSEFGRNKRR